MFYKQDAGSVWGVSFAALRQSQINSLVINVLYHFAVGTIKCSFLLMYLSITPIRWHHVLIYIVLFICAASNVAGFFYQIFKNKPVNYWDHWLERVNHGEIDSKFIFGIGIINIATDCMIW